MTPLDVIVDLERDPLPGVSFATLLAHNTGESSKIEAMGLMRQATKQGRATVMLKIVLPDGSVTVAETTWRLLRTAVHALEQSPISLEET